VTVGSGLATTKTTEPAHVHQLHGRVARAVPCIGASETTPQSPAVRFRRDLPVVTSADQVLNVQDFEPLARAALPPAHFGYIATGADDGPQPLHEITMRSHTTRIRAHRFSDLAHVTTATQVFGAAWSTPIYLSAVSAMRAFNPEGEIAAASAAASRSVQIMLSTGTSLPIEAVVAARGGAVWQQLYPTDDWSVTTGIIRRARDAGCLDIVLTADLPRFAQQRDAEAGDARRQPSLHGLPRRQLPRHVAPRPNVRGLGRLASDHTRTSRFEPGVS